MSRSRIVNLANFEQFSAINVLSDPGHIGGPVVVPNTVRVLLRIQLTDGKQGTVVLGGIVSGGFTPTPSICDAILSGLTTGATWTTFAGFLASTTNFLRVDIQDIRSANLPLVNGTQTAHAGTAAGAALPDEVALVATFRTNRSGPSGRGRMYWPGWAVGAVGAAGVVIAAAVTAYQNWVNTIPTTLTGQAIQLALVLPARAQYTGSTGTVHPARAASSIPITAQSVRNNTWDSQRRRGLK